MKGYTEILGKTEDMKLKDFAMLCARNFGTLIDMRDKPLDAPIPERFEPDPYYKNELEKAKAKYAEFMALSDDEKSDLLERRYNEMVERYKTNEKRQSEEKEVLRKRYEKMLQKVLKWQAPTPDHENLRNFMIQQIQDTIEWDCSEYKPHLGSKEDWCDIQKHIQDLKKDIEISQEHYDKEVGAYEKRNKWLADLRESLKDCD